MNRYAAMRWAYVLDGVPVVDTDGTWYVRVGESDFCTGRECFAAWMRGS